MKSEQHRPEGPFLLLFHSHLPTWKTPPLVPRSTKDTLSPCTEEINKCTPWALGFMGTSATCNIPMNTSVLGVSPIAKTKHDAGEDQGREPRSGTWP